MRISEYIGLHVRPGRIARVVLPLTTFVVLVAIYVIASDMRHAINADDKLLPTFAQMGDAIWRMAFEEDKRTGDILLWTDTYASLVRLGIGVSAGAFFGLILGINLGLFPIVRATFAPILTTFSIVPPLTLLPVLFIVLGVGEASKIVLIFIGTVFVITRDIQLAVKALPPEQKTKALTLGINEMSIAYRIVPPQVTPRLLNTVRLVLGGAWLFLIAAEAVASTDGLGYRIYLVRRYMSMDVIIPYVVWITLLGFSFDFSLRTLARTLYPWYGQEK